MSRRRPGWAFRGLALARELESRAKALGLSQGATARNLDIAPPYFNLLMNGRRPWESLAREKMLAIADFLDVPLVTVLMLAEVLEPDDFFRASRIEPMLDAAYKRLARDRRFLGAMPNEESWRRTPRDVQLAFIGIAEQLAGRSLLEKTAILDIEYHHH